MSQALPDALANHEPIVLDGHADTPQRFVDEGWNWEGDALGTGQLSGATARQGGLHGGFLIAWPEPEQWRGRYAERTAALIDSIHQQAARHPAALQVCTSVTDVLEARQAGRFAALISTLR